MSPSNGGITGLWEYPTAEILDDGQGRFGYTDANPYITYYLAMGYLPNANSTFESLTLQMSLNRENTAFWQL